jgi:hypothetical protein
VRRDSIELTILGRLRGDLLASERVRQMAKEMQVAYAEQVKQAATWVQALPQELQALDARIDRLRERLKCGHPELTADEMQAAIERAEAKRSKLSDARPTERENARVLAMLPRTADYYRDQIDRGLGDDLVAAAEARAILRDILAKSCFRPLPMDRSGRSSPWNRRPAERCRNMWSGWSDMSSICDPVAGALQVAHHAGGS